MEIDSLIWDVRAFVYAHFVETTHAPTADDIAARFVISSRHAGDVLRILHDRHALFLEPGSTRIRIANPFSAIPTSFKVDARGKTYTANCAWDSFGVVAALHERDADVHATCAQNGEPVNVSIRNGEVIESNFVAHFLVPFRHWYDDLIHT